MRRLMFCFVLLGMGVFGVFSLTHLRAVRAGMVQDEPHGTVQGKLTGADGSPIGSAWVSAIPAEGDVDADNPEQLTGDDGSFTLDVPPGRYFIVANYDWPATQNAPVLTTYHPSAENESGAQPVEVKLNQKLKGIDIHVTRVLTPKYFEVVVTGADGAPVPSADAYITQTNQAGIAGSDSGASYVDKNGHVKLMGFVGLDYLLFAENGVGMKKTCAAVMKLDKDHAPSGVITMQITKAQPNCRAQEDAARKAAYAMQSR
jgi:hypothetical protein